jgi:gamma-D-glutamyl-L-lysine dipeptidyl-peptidase
MKKHLAAVFLIAFIFSSCSSEGKTAEETYTIKNDIYDAVAIEMLADIYTEASLDSVRITQVLYNQPLKIQGSKDGFYLVSAIGNVEGYILENKVIINTDSLRTNVNDQKILVTGESKTVYSKPDGKIPVEKIVAGTVFAYRGKLGDWIRIEMADGTNGYLTLNNIILYEGQIPVTDADSFIRDIIAYSDAKYLEGGISATEGFDMPNLINLCARINGVELPLGINELKDEGVEVTDGVIKKGDILFLSKDRYNKTVTSAAVALDDVKAVFFSEEQHMIVIGKLMDEDIRSRTQKIIRIFEEQG